MSVIFYGVVSAVKTQFDGMLTLVVDADDGLGGGRTNHPYGYRRGELEGIGPEVDAFFDANPDFPIADYVPPAPVGEEIDAERDRRIAAPLGITLSGPRSFSINMDDSALRNMNGLATAAVLAKVLGSTAATNFIAYDNSEISLSPDDLIAMGLQVQARISAMTFAGRALKNTTPIPADFAADSYWA